MTAIYFSLGKWLGCLAVLLCLLTPAVGQVVINVNGSATTAEQEIPVGKGQVITLSPSRVSSANNYVWVQNDANTVSYSNTFRPTYTGFYRISVDGVFSNYVYINFLDASQNKNYAKVDLIRTRGIKYEGSIANLSTSQLNQQVTYLDGLGRTLQQIAVASAPQTQKDVVQPFAYDGAQGEQTRSYLPFTVGNDGQYKPSWRNDQSNFYTYAAKVGRPQNGPTFAESVSDADPLNRVREQASPGGPWQLNGGHTRKQTQRANQTGGAAGLDDQVRQWVYQPVANVNSLVSSNGTLSWAGVAPANSLQVTETTDEDGKLTVQYLDELGRVVCSRVYLADTPAHNANASYLETNYCYDSRGLLVATVPPKATQQLLAGTITATDALNKLCFLSYYDNLGRPIARKTPGVNWAYSLYDRWNRIAFTKDPTGIYSKFVKYDVLNRPVATGFASESRDIASLATYLQTLTDDQRFEVRAENEAGYSLTNSYPFNATTNSITTTSYYDDYNYSPLRRPALSYFGELANSAATTQTRGLQTGSRERVLGQQSTLGNWLTTVTYYDEFARPLQTFQDNHTISNSGVPAVDRITKHYEDGLLTQISQTHQRYSSAGVLETHTVKTTNSYDPKGRLLTVSESIDGSSSVRLVAYEYNELGQIVDKKLGYNPSDATYLQSLDYRYNIRGWLTNINNRNLYEGWLDDSDPNSDPDASKDLFGLELKYATSDNDAAHRLYNGNISGVIWNSGTPKGAMRQYQYAYDQANRLQEGIYGALTYANNAYSFNGEKDAGGEGRYTLKGLQYDPNGNILGLQRYGLTDYVAGGNKQFGQLDNLQYAYDGNQLQTVQDVAHSGSPTVASNDFENNGVTTERYRIDAAGNVTYDPHKKAWFYYNSLNLPYEIDVNLGSSSYIVNTYSTSGRKLSVSYSKYNTSLYRYEILRSVDYINGFTYDTSAPLVLATPVGRAVVMQAATTSNSRTYWGLEYHIRDHQGSLRLVIRQDPQMALNATMEPVNSIREETDFDNVAQTRQFDPDHARSGDYSARLNAHQVSRATGPYTTLPVSKGDSVRVEVFGQYDGSRKVVALPLIEAATAITLSTPANGPPVGEIPRAQTRRLPAIFLGITTTLEKVVGLFGKKEAELPRASLTYEFYDKDSALVSTNTLYLDENGRRNWQQLAGGQKATADGYVNIFLANASGKDAWFDDLSVTTVPITAVQENHYDPFGQNLVELETASSFDSKYQYTGQEKIDDFGLNLSDYTSRYYDYQLGRFTVVDAATFRYPQQGPYNYVKNSPVNHVDPDGKNPLLIAAAILGAAYNVYNQYQSGNLHSGWDYFKAAGIGAVAGVAGAVTGSFIAPLVGGGVIGGAITGAFAGYAGGFATGFGNGVVFNGNSLGEGFRTGNSSGLQGAALGAATGAFFGLGNGLWVKPNWLTSSAASVAGTTGAKTNGVAKVDGAYPNMPRNSNSPYTPISDEQWEKMNNIEKSFYRGFTGNETDGKQFLYVTEDADYAQFYVKEGQQLMELRLPVQTFNQYVRDGLIERVGPGHYYDPANSTNSYNIPAGTEWRFTDATLKEYLIPQFKPHTP